MSEGVVTDFDLPYGWALTTLEAICANNRDAMTDGPFGSRLKSSHYVANGVRVIRLGNIGVGEFKQEDEAYISEGHASQLTRHSVQAGDLVIAALAEPVGRCCQVPASIPPAIVKADCVRLRPANAVSPRFIMHWLNSPAGAKNAERHSHGVGRLRINMQEMRALAVPIAPRSEQDRVVAEIEKQFTRLDEAVATLKAVQAKLKRARASVLKAAVEGRLVPTEAELARAEGRSYEPASELLERILAERRARWPKGKKYQPPAEPKTDDLPGLPEGWAWASPAELADGLPHSLGIGPFGSDLKVSDYQPAGVPLVFVRNIRTGLFRAAGTPFVSPEKAAKLQAHQVRPADILITKMGDPPGDSCVYPAGYPLAIMTADCIRWRIHPDCGLPWFFAYATRTQAVRGQVLERTQGVAQKKLSLARFGHVAYPVAPPPEQVRIVAEVERRLSVLDSLEHTVEQNLARCGRLRQSILKRAFEGKLVPQDPSDEPASRLLERIRAATDSTDQSAAKQGNGSRRRPAVSAGAGRRR